MANSATTDGPYFEGTGEIKFSQLRNTFTGNTGLISASELLRKTEITIKSPVVPDCTENSAVAESTDWKVSQMRGTIKRYDVTQSGSDQDLVGPSVGWNNNLTKNIPKTYSIEGNITSSSHEAAALTFERSSSSPIANLTVFVRLGASILGAGGLGGSWVDRFGLTNNQGSDGGNAFNFDSIGGQNNIIVLPNTTSLTVAGGGGGGGRGGTGPSGSPGPCWKPRINVISDNYTGNKDPGTGEPLTDYNPGPFGEWYSYKIGGNCQCEYTSSCPDPSTPGRNAPITISVDGVDTTYNSRGFGGSATGQSGSGTFHSNKGGRGCNAFRIGFKLFNRNTCLDGAYCAVEDPVETRGGAGGEGGLGGDGRGCDRSRENGTAGGLGEAKNCPTIGSNGGDGGRGGNGGDFGEPGQDGEGQASTTTTSYTVPWSKWTPQTAWVQASLNGGSANDPRIWSQFMRTYAVYPSNTDPLIGTHTAIWRLGGGSMGGGLAADTYTLECHSDNNSTFTFDSTFLGSLTQVGSEKTSTFFTITNTQVTEHYLTVSITNVDNGFGWDKNPAGVAWQLKNSSGTVIRSSTDSFNYDYASNGWGSFLNTYAVYPSTTESLINVWHETNYLFTPSAGLHSIEGVGDAQSEFYLDDGSGSGETLILSTSANEICSIGACSSASLGILSNQVYRLKVRVYNASTPSLPTSDWTHNPGGVGFIIKNSSGSIIKSSLNTGDQGSIVTELSAGAFYRGGNAGKAIYGSGYIVQGVNADNVKGEYIPNV